MKLVMSLGVVALAAGSVSAQLYSNAGGYGSGAIGLSTGSVTGSGVSAPAGFEWSEAQNDGAGNANTTAGYTVTLSGSGPNFRIADDFTIPVGETWTITNILTYAYQTGSAANTQPINGGSINIWNGAPNAGGVVVASGSFGSSANTNIYRIFSTTTPAPGTAPGTSRLIREVTWNFSGLSLSSGTYWIDFQLTATNAGTLFAPALTLPGTRGLNGWNGLQLSTQWATAVDGGNPASAPDLPQDFPFVIVPAPSAAAMLGLGVLTLGRRRR